MHLVALRPQTVAQRLERYPDAPGARLAQKALHKGHHHPLEIAVTRHQRVGFGFGIEQQDQVARFKRAKAVLETHSGNSPLDWQGSGRLLEPPC
jgi:hypothetical protein